MLKMMVVEQRFRQATTITNRTNDGGGITFSANHHHRRSRNGWWRKPVFLNHYHRYARIIKIPQQFRPRKNSCPPHPPQSRPVRESPLRRVADVAIGDSEAMRRSERRADGATLPGRPNAAVLLCSATPMLKWRIGGNHAKSSLSRLPSTDL